MHRKVVVSGLFVLLTLVPTTLVAQPTPDLSVAAIGFEGPSTLAVTPANTAPGGLLNVSAVLISNQGAAPATSFTVGLYLSLDSQVTAADQRLATTSFGGLGAGASSRWAAPRDLVVPSNLTPGDYYVGVLVDDSGALAESDETNNVTVALVPVHVLPPVDADLVPGPLLLVIGDVTTGDGRLAVAAPEATVSLFNWSVSNRGTEATPGFSVAFYISNDNVITPSDRRIGTRTVSSGVAAGGFHQSLMHDFQVRLPEDVGPGSYFLGIIVDVAQQVLETALGREANNSRGTPLQILAVPSDSTLVWRLLAEITTCDIRDAHTDDYVYASVNPNNRSWLDYPRDDFERGETFRYDLVLDGVATFGDIRYLQIGKEGNNGWCSTRVHLYVNEREVFSRSFLPAGRWIDTPPPNPSFQITYVDLRSSASWAAYLISVPSLITPATFESIVTASVANALRENGGYWGHPSDGKAVEVSFVSESTVHLNIEFRAYVAAYPDVRIVLNLDASVGCTCGEIALEIGNLNASASSGWYPGALKDHIAKEIESRFTAISTTMSTGIAACPHIRVRSPFGHIEIGLPPLTQDLSLTTAANTKLQPGSNLVVSSSVANIGSQPSGSFGLDMYIYVGASTPSIPMARASGIRIGTGADQASLAACETTAFSETVALPRTLECSAAALGRDYWLVSVLRSASEPWDNNNATVLPLKVSLPDLSVSRLKVRRTGMSLTIGQGVLRNVGGVMSDRVEYDVSLVGAAGASRRYPVARGELDAIPAGGQVPWPTVVVPISAAIPAGQYSLVAVVRQKNQGSECDFSNNRQTVLLELP